MGVSALFIATLAKHRLAEPRNPPETQEDYLALALHPIVSFVILISIIVRESALVYHRLYQPELILCKMDCQLLLSVLERKSIVALVLRKKITPSNLVLRRLILKQPSLYLSG